MHGHGTYLEQVVLFAGVVEIVNTVISVTPINGEFVDMVVGRIVKVQQKREKVDIKLSTAD